MVSLFLVYDTEEGFRRKKLRAKITTPIISANMKIVNVKNDSRARLATIQSTKDTLFQKEILLV